VNDFLFQMSLHMHHACVLFDRFATWDHLEKMLQTLLVLMNFAGRGGKLCIENVTLLRLVVGKCYCILHIGISLWIVKQPKL